jgi:hypothetical protein
MVQRRISVVFGSAWISKMGHSPAQTGAQLRGWGGSGPALPTLMSLPSMEA